MAKKPLSSFGLSVFFIYLIIHHLVTRVFYNINYSVMKIVLPFQKTSFLPIAFCIVWLLHLPLLSQKQGNNWYFGDKAGVNFNPNPPVALTNGQTDFVLPIGWNEASSTISDSSGTLLFYSNGVLVWNRFHAVMPNGSALMGHRSSTGGCIIVPKPGNQQLFYVFTLGAEETGYVGGFRYSIADMCLDGGKGDIDIASKNIFLEDSMTEKMVCIRHANNIDYWIVVHKMTTRKYYSFLLTSSGITNTVVSVTDTIHYIGVGQMKASPNGLKIAVATPNGYGLGNGFHQGFTSLMDFNPATGIVSNAVALPPSAAKTDYGVCFSPDNSKLYFSCVGHGEIYQYNLSAGPLASVIASKTWIIPNGPDSWRQMANGPDGKIYISRGQKNYLSVLNSPNNVGLACNYIDSTIYLQGKKTSIGLPNLITGFKYNNLLATGPIMISSTNVSICPGNATTLAVVGASQYTWSNNNSTASALVVSPTVTTTYSVVGSKDGCASSASINVYVLPTPAMSVTGPFTICPGESVTITASGAENYLWSNNANTSSIVVTPLIPTTYTVSGTNSNLQCSAVQIVFLTLDPCTSISTYTQTKLLLYPNPVHDHFIIEAKVKQQIQLINVLGQIQRVFELSASENYCDVQELPSGIYFLRDPSAGVTFAKIIKK